MIMISTASKGHPAKRQHLGNDIYCLHNKAFMTYIRPMLEYSSGVWSPTQAGLIDKLDSVQRHVTKRILAIHELSYREIGLLP